MNLDFNTITDERGEEIAELFDQFFHNPNTLQFTGQELFKLFTEKHIGTPEELVIATLLFSKEGHFRLF